MLTEVKYLYSDSDQYCKDAFSQPMPRSVFMRHVREGVDKLCTRSVELLRNYRMYANILESYLTHFGVEEVQPTEPFIQVMWERLKESGQFQNKAYEWETRKKVPRFTRKILNEYFFEKGLSQRKLVKEIVIQRYERFFKLSKNSQDAIKWFEQNGKRVEAMSVLIQNENAEVDPTNQIIRTIHRVTGRELLPLTKNGKIEHAIRFLEYVNINGFEEATKEDVQKFREVCAQRGIKQIEDYLAHVTTFYINIHAKGFVKSNPFANVSLKMNGGAVKKDFITVEGIAKLKDLTTLDRTNKEDVRDRLVALLGYDLALRRGELLSLRISDFKKDEQGEWFVLIRSEIQKGNNKDAEIMYFFFEETKEVLDLYLKKIRDRFRPTTDFLIISSLWGKALSPERAAIRFGNLCQKLGITTYYGGKPSPHLLRHSFATLNIEPIGLALPLYEMIQRLRHSRVETTRKHYIHNNPYLKKIKHDVLRRNNRKKTTTDVLNELPLAELEHWFSDKLGMDSTAIRHFRDNHKKAFCETPVDKKAEDNKIFIPEDEAVACLSHLQIPLRALRQYAIKRKSVAKGFDGTARWGKGFRYDRTLIEDLSQNWVPVESLREKLKLGRNIFYRTLQKENWRNLRIGRKRYVHKLDCV